MSTAEPARKLSAADGLAIAFPGQGNKLDATIDALTRYREHPLAAAFLDHFALDPSELNLHDTRMAQPATYVCGLASVEEMFGQDASPAAVLGHSLGELTALAQAGVLDPWDGLALAERRGQICYVQQKARSGSMIAVMGADLVGIEWIRRQAIARSGGVLELAGLNGRRQTVLSGDTHTAQQAMTIAGELGVLAEVLPVGGSFHSPLMADAIVLWREAVEAVPFKPASTTVVSTIDAGPHTAPGELRELLIRALLLPVRWLDATKAVRDLGVERVWDAGPGETLHKLGRREHIVKFVCLAGTRLEVDA
ncbi:MAG: ACP S-malonyltransferase [Pseudonocardiaceae bacterium]